MWSAEYPPSQREIRGKTEMHKLVMAAVEALQRSNLCDMTDDLQRRLFGRGIDSVLDARLAGDVWYWQFKPMVELVLRHVADVSSNPARTHDERRREILFALEYSGF